MKLIPRDDGFALLLKVTPGASRARIVGPYGEGWKVAVTAAPERGAANEAVVKLLAEALGVPIGQVEILRGRTSPRKEALVRGLTADEIVERLNAASA